MYFCKLYLNENMNKQKLDIIIISYNCAEYTVRCIDSIYETADDIVNKIIVVDNASEDGSVGIISKKYPKVELIVSDTNLGYAGAVNIGAASSNAGYIIVSNADVIYPKDSISTLFDYIVNNPRVAAVGPQQIYGDGSWEYSYGILPGVKAVVYDILMISSLKRGLRKLLWGKIKLDKFPRDVEYIDGAVMLIDKIVFDQLDGFDEDYFFYSEEADFCHRARQNYKYCIFHPKAIVTHYRGVSTVESLTTNKSAEMLINSKMIFCMKHRTRIETSMFKTLSKFDMRIKAGFWKILSSFASGSSKIKNKAQNYRIWDEEWRKI